MRRDTGACRLETNPYSSSVRNPSIGFADCILPTWLTVHFDTLSYLILGATGRGKTEFLLWIFRQEIERFIDDARKTAVFLLDAKGNLAIKAQSIAERIGRSADFYLLGLPSNLYPNLPKRNLFGADVGSPEEVSDGFVAGRKSQRTADNDVAEWLDPNIAERVAARIGIRRAIYGDAHPSLSVR